MVYIKIIFGLRGNLGYEENVLRYIIVNRLGQILIIMCPKLSFIDILYRLIYNMLNT